MRRKLYDVLSGEDGSRASFAYACAMVAFIVASLVPFLILAFSKNREKKGVVVLASALVVLGVACKRVWLLFTSFIHPNIYGGAGITTGTQAAQTDPSAMWTTLGSYAPTVPEIVIFVGVVSLGIMAFMVLSKKLVATDNA